MNSRIARFLGLTCILAAVCCAAPRNVRSQAEGTVGPVAPPPKFEIKRIPDRADSAPPPIPTEQLIRQLAANEDVMKKAYDGYTFKQTIRIQELRDSGGELSMTGQLYTKPDGQRYEHILERPPSTLKYTGFTIDDVRTLTGLPLFLLTTDQLVHYNLQYLGKEKLDELSTYIFRVQPKQVDRVQRYFDGVVWVDDHDLTIVKSSGQFVNELSGSASSGPLPFHMFDTYRENIDGKYWLPTYVSSDDYVQVSKQDNVHVKMVIRSTDFKRETPGGSATAPGSAQPTISSAPGSAN